MLDILEIFIIYQGINNLQFVDQRAFQRVKVDLKGRFLLLCGEEYDCDIHEMSPGGLCVTCNVPDDIMIGKHYIICIDQIGRIEGKIIRFDTKRGYAVRIIASANIRRKIANNLTLISDKDDLSN